MVEFSQNIDIKYKTNLNFIMDEYKKKAEKHGNEKFYKLEIFRSYQWC